MIFEGLKLENIGFGFERGFSFRSGVQTSDADMVAANTDSLETALGPVTIIDGLRFAIVNASVNLNFGFE